MKVRNFFVVMAVVFWSAVAFAEPLSFSPDKGVSVTLVPDKNNLTVITEGKNGSKTEAISFQTEKAMHVEIDDYNFDRLKDFSVWYIDDGMGTYSIHRIFIYIPENSTFKELSPACGDEFINLKVDKAKRILNSTYYKANEPALCVTKPSRK